MSNRRDKDVPKLIENEDFDDDYEDFEWHAILRLPPSKAAHLDEIMAVEKSTQSEDGEIDDDDIEYGFEKTPIGINFDRQELRINDEIIGFRMYNLPCIVETYKTFDKVNVLKIADVSQILICNEDAATSSSMNNSELDNSNLETINRFPHGLTPPMKNVTKVRFRDGKKDKFVDVLDQELREILGRDMDAHKIEFQLLDEDGNRIDTPEEPILAPVENENLF